MKLVFNGTEDSGFAQPPRNCLKTHEDAIIACGESRTFCYIPSENEWYELAGMLSSRPFVCQAISSCCGKIYCIGGNIEGDPAECYDPSTNTWTPLKSFDKVLKNSTIVTFQGALYVIGGTDKGNEQLNTVQEYNPDTNAWREVAPLSIARSSVCTVADRNMLYAIGGISSHGEFMDIVERFDPAENTWSRIASTHNKRGGAGDASVNQKVFVFGGLDNGVPVSEFCEMYDPAVDTWSCITQTVSLCKGLIYKCNEFQGKNICVWVL